MSRDWVFGALELAELWGVARQRIPEYVERGMPKTEKRGKYDARAATQWLLEQLASENDAQDVVEARKRLYEAQEQRTRLEAAKTAGELIPYDEYCHAVNGLAGLFISSVEGLSPRLASISAELDEPAVIEQRLEVEFRALRESLGAQVRAFFDERPDPRANGDTAPGTKRGRVGGRQKKASARKPRAGTVAN